MAHIQNLGNDGIQAIFS